MEEKIKSVQQKLYSKLRRIRKWRGWMTALTAGIGGSFFTILFSSHLHLTELSAQERQPEIIEAVSNNHGNISQHDSFSSIGDTIEEVSKAIVGVVNIRGNIRPYLNSNQIESGTGSGIIFKKDAHKAYIVTNYHVIDQANEIGISLHCGKKVTAKTVGSDPLTDLAVLEIPAKHVTATAKFGDSSVLRTGDQVLAIGNPLGLHLSRTVTQGIISSKERAVPVSTVAGDWELDVLQTDAAINPGNSGGALINLSGEVIGVNSLKISQSGVEGIGFALPSNDVIPIVEEILENGKVHRPYIGITLVDLSHIHPSYLNNLPENILHGVLVTSIDENAKVAKRNLVVEDIIIAVNDEEVKTITQFRKNLYTNVKKGNDIKLTIFRNGKLLFTTIPINELQA